MSDYVDNFDWGLPADMDVDSIDWTELKEEVMAGPWGPVWEEAEVETQPGDRILETPDTAQQMGTSARHLTLPTKQPLGTLTGPECPALVCNEPGCRSEPFKRRGDLNRHMLTHKSQRKFECPAQACDRVGKRGFARTDKASDHMLAGHDEDTLFSCYVCSSTLTRDLIPLHMKDFWYSVGHVLAINRFRTCPMPRCSFKTRSKRLDALQKHLLQKHDVKGRANFAQNLKQKGYDFQSCEILCPLCPIQLRDHESFYAHFDGTHFYGPICGWTWAHNCSVNCEGRSYSARLGAATLVPDDVRLHRRTILRLWPDFENYPVWADFWCRRQR